MSTANNTGKTTQAKIGAEKRFKIKAKIAAKLEAKSHERSGE